MAPLNNEEFRKRLLKPLDQIHNESTTPSDTNKPVKVRGDNDPTTLYKYVSNPTGKGSSFVANRSAIKSGLNMTFIKLLREHRKAFYAIPYVYPNGDLLYWVKVPSEFYKDNSISYDVLFLIKYSETIDRKNRDMEVFSNSPSFVYTYCYVYNKHDMLINQLKDKFPSQALTMPPVVRNPIESFGYEKSTYIAARYLLDGRCLTDEYINRYSKIINDQNEMSILGKVADPELLVSIYQHAQYESRKTHRKEISDSEKKQKQDQKNEYVKNQKKVTPRKGFIVQRSPRSKITARQAQRSLMNDKKRK